MKKLIFRCPSICGNKKRTLEEIMDNCWASSTIKIDEAGEATYGDTVYDGGYVTRYQCKTCGYTVTNEDGKLITDVDELFQYLVKNQ